MKHWDEADARSDGHAEGYREGQREALLWVARLLATGPISKTKAAWMAGMAHLAYRGNSLPDITHENPATSHTTAPETASGNPDAEKAVRKNRTRQKGR